MYKNKATNGRKYITRLVIAKLRKNMVPKTSQPALADIMQLEGIGLDNNSIFLFDGGHRFVSDIELKTFAKVLGVSCDTLLS